MGWSQATARGTHPDSATLVDPLFAARKEGEENILPRKCDKDGVHGREREHFSRHLLIICHG